MRRAKNEIVRVGRLGRRDDFLGLRLGPPIGQVLPDAPPKQKRFLEHHAHAAAQVLAAQPAHVDSIEEHPPLVHVVEPHSRLTSVVLPEPLRPTTPTISPGRIVNSTSCSTGVWRR